MEVKWSALAEEQLNEILNYYTEKGNNDVAQKTLKSIIKATNRLALFPKLGIEIADLHSVRLLIERNYKIFYRIKDNCIEINFLFETRQNPDILWKLMK